MRPLGRRVPPDRQHVERFALADIGLAVPPWGVEKGLGLPWWWKQHDQGAEGSCVGFGCSAMMSITNARQRWLRDKTAEAFRYDARWLYQEAQLVDDWDDTPPEEGTSVRAGCDILRLDGHRRIRFGVESDPDPAQGIAANRWATTVDDVRAAIYANLAVAIGVDWYSNFDDPELYFGELWIGRRVLGHIRGGHCVCLYRMSDRRHAFRVMNSWGAGYPPVWLPYDVLERLLDDNGEAAVITDR